MSSLNHYQYFYFRVEEKFAGGKFREIPFEMDIIFAGGKFRAKSKFAKIAKLNSTRKIGVIQYTPNTGIFQKQPCHLPENTRVQSSVTILCATSYAIMVHRPGHSQNKHRTNLRPR